MLTRGSRVIVEYRGKLDDGTEFADTKAQGMSRSSSWREAASCCPISIMP